MTGGLGWLSITPYPNVRRLRASHTPGDSSCEMKCTGMVNFAADGCYQSPPIRTASLDNPLLIFCRNFAKCLQVLQIWLVHWLLWSCLIMTLILQANHKEWVTFLYYRVFSTSELHNRRYLPKYTFFHSIWHWLITISTQPTDWFDPVINRMLFL